MIRPMNWTDRTFTFDMPPEMYPNVLERLRGTPARLTERLSLMPHPIRIRRHGSDWSIQEHAGHLWDIVSLEAARLEDYLAGRDTLTPADMSNRKTYEANHNASPVERILDRFRSERLALVSRMEDMDASVVVRPAYHARLDTPMRLLDCAYFFAEHDDHHLVQITELVHHFNK